LDWAIKGENWATFFGAFNISWGGLGKSGVWGNFGGPGQGLKKGVMGGFPLRD